MSTLEALFRFLTSLGPHFTPFATISKGRRQYCSGSFHCVHGVLCRMVICQKRSVFVVAGAFQAQIGCKNVQLAAANHHCPSHFGTKIALFAPGRRATWANMPQCLLAATKTPTLWPILLRFCPRRLGSLPALLLLGLGSVQLRRCPSKCADSLRADDMYLSDGGCPKLWELLCAGNISWAYATSL